MGFRLNVDLETGSGPTQEAYIRIDNYRFNKVTSELLITTTTWLNIEKAQAFNRKYLDENLKNAVGLVASEVLYYPSPDSEGEEITIPNVFKAAVVEEEEITFPIYEEQETIVQVPYVSFDANGDEVTKYKDEIRKIQLEVDSYKEVKRVVKPELLSNLYEFSYSVLFNELAELFPEDKIEKL